jgi:tetratricopeptide (TPR) repeat protein
MDAGMQALYERGDAKRAAELFHDVLKAMPSHYGANFQLAKALDAAGEPLEAERQWHKVLLAAREIGDADSTATAEARGAEAGRAAKMRDGMRLLYGEGKSEEAAAVFRAVLAELPGHYGANFQLARALERTDNAAEALVAWERMLKLAQAIGDTGTAAWAEQSLRDINMAEGMRRGIAELYERHEPAAAATQFRAVLAMLPAHYGANYQLAVALDAAGRPDEARKLWKQVQKLAQAAKDEWTLAAAKKALAR